MKYENNWESLNKREVPSWFEDAKFGIFIHWGLYSVPAYAPKGKYAEWYGYHCDEILERSANDRDYYDYHQKTYGENFKGKDIDSASRTETVSGATKTTSAYKKAVLDALSVYGTLTG